MENEEGIKLPDDRNRKVTHAQKKGFQNRKPLFNTNQNYLIRKTESIS